MAMDRNTIYLRVAYWTAAVADFIVAALVLIPERNGVSDYVYPMGLMSAVALSWGVMLVLADRRPLERRWMLVPTILVVVLLGVVQLHAGMSGLLPLARIVGSVTATVVVLTTLVLGSLKTRAADRYPIAADLS
jgi:hypothetical protein